MLFFLIFDGCILLSFYLSMSGIGTHYFVSFDLIAAILNVAKRYYNVLTMLLKRHRALT